jgi:hypothetical protein
MNFEQPLEENNSENIEAQKEFVSFLEKGNFHSALETKDKLNLSPELINSPEVQEAAQEGYKIYIKEGNYDDIFGFKDKFNLSPEFIDSPEVKELIVKGKYLYSISCGWPKDELKEEFDFSPEFINSPEAQRFARFGFVESLAKGRFDTAKKIKDEFALSSEIIKNGVDEAFETALKDGNVLIAHDIHEEFHP